MFLMVVGLHGKLIRPEPIAEKLLDWDDISKNKKKLVAMRSRRETLDPDGDARPSLDLEAVRARVCDDSNKRPIGSTRDQHKKGMKHWFKKDMPSGEDVIAQRLAPPQASRLPALEPLPSSEDSFLAFTCDDELFFDPPVRERWKELVDEKTAVVRVRRSEEKSYSFAGEALFAGDAAGLCPSL
jgi:hypothetical protein